ncbi:Glutathione S-transferase zeta-1 [Dissophora globulifera]|nr:Glutathione S-transferase zeta-1 [Dissophora globulifera]
MSTTATANLPVLYSYFRSSCSWRVRVALKLKKIDHEIRYINLLKNEQRSEEYLKIQPFGFVPAFVDNRNGKTLIESVSIMEYLDETYPEFPLLPKDPQDRATVRALVQAVAMDIQPVTNLRVLRYLEEDKRSAWSKHWSEEGFKAIESLLVKSAKTFSVGDSLTMADIVLVPQVYNAVRFGVDMSVYPTVSRLYRELSELPEFHEAHPSRQGDCPPELR